MRFSYYGLLLAATLVTTRAAEFTFQNDHVRLVIGSDAQIKTLEEKKTGHVWLAPKPTPFALLRKNGKTYAASSLSRNGNTFAVTFGASAVEADYQITAKPFAIVFELAKLRGEGVDEVRLAQLPVNITENAGSILNVRWNDQFAVCLMALSDAVEAKLIGLAVTATAHAEQGIASGTGLRSSFPHR